MNQTRIIFLITVLLVVLSSCKNQISPKDLQGSWNITDVEINAPNGNDILLNKAKESYYSTKYTFAGDSSVVVTIAENSTDKAINYEGNFIFEEKNKIKFIINKVAVKNNNEWQYLDKNKFPLQIFKDFLFTIESFTSKEMIFIETEGNKTIILTLTKQHQ